ncbi:MAG: hypothetical protein CEE43_19550 [Promethearchaeota archaeon Loki_b32]|nr:MAG: hypothetical protein CEE43_19550 [Candidatus Lokiarchaeota archaeon Loki_b32]
MKNMKFGVKDVFKEDFGKNIARIDPEIIFENNLNAGDIICIYNDSTKKSTAAIAFPSDLKDKGTKIVRIDAILRRNLNASIDDIVRIRRIKSYLAQQVSLAGFQQNIVLKNPNILTEKLKNSLVSIGDIFSFCSGKKKIELIVINHTPQADAVKIHEDTTIFFQEKAYQEGL